jgi:hypothetical protein
LNGFCSIVALVSKEASMTIHDKARQLAQYLQSLAGFVIVDDIDGNYNHMGATITDAILQAGITYETVVRPRVRRVIGVYPSAVTTSAFWNLLEEIGPKTVLSWQDDEKPNRVVALTAFLRDEGIETEDELRAWLATEVHRMRLLSVRGVGPKTVDYIRILVGTQTVAVDRHAYALLAAANIQASGYAEAREILNLAADNMGVARATLDQSVWQFMSAKKGNPPEGTIMA